MRGVRTAIVVSLAAGLATELVPALVGAQGGRRRVEYDVEFTTTGPLLDANCAAAGTDILSGTLVGHEPVLPDEPNEYVGRLMRSTRITVCGSRTTTGGTEVVCSINITGGGFPAVMLTVRPGGQGGYLQYVDSVQHWAALRLPSPPQGQAHSTVTGTCDPAELADLQRGYDNGQTAGSPSGQPIEIAAFPPSSFPATFAANPPQSIWTLTVLRRRP